MTFSIKVYFVTLSKTNILHKQHLEQQQSAIILSVIMLSVIMLSVIMLSTIMLSAIMLSVIVLNVIMLSVISLSVMPSQRFYLFLCRTSL
jgi:hypothetical protein